MSVSPALGQANERIQDIAYVGTIQPETGHRRMSLKHMRNGDLQCSGGSLRIGTWNVEHLIDLKIVELQLMMIERHLDILCLQETNTTGVEFYITDEEFLIILSGGPSGERNYTGVGFLVVLAVRRCVVTFYEHTDRLVSLKLRVIGG